MVRIELLRWPEARPLAAPIRFAVFVDEQKVPVELELDERDASCVHAVAFNDAGHPVGTGRLLPDGHIGRMAVMHAVRGQGVGGQVLEALIAEARRRGHAEAVLSAQAHALGFYRKFGFEAFGPVYDEAGIAHQDMRRRL